MTRIYKLELFFERISRVTLTGRLLFEDEASRVMEDGSKVIYTIPLSHTRIEFEPETIILSDNSEDKRLRLLRNRKGIYKSLQKDTALELYLKDDLVSLIGYLVKLNQLSIGYCNNMDIRIFDHNYEQAIVAGFDRDRLEHIINTFKNDFSKSIIDDIIQPYIHWIDNLDKCVSINKSLNMAKKAIEAFSNIPQQIKQSRKSKVEKTFYLLGKSRNEANLELLYNFLKENHWIGQTSTLNDFRAIFLPNCIQNNLITWNKTVGSLSSFILFLKEKKIINESKSMWVTAGSLFFILKRPNLATSLSSSVTKPVKADRHLTRLEEFTEKLFNNSI